MTEPLTQSAIQLFALISANAGSTKSMHINVLFHVAKQPKAQIEATLIELMTKEYIEYDYTSKHIHLVRRNERQTNRSKTT
jgi:hypothetical protein